MDIGYGGKSGFAGAKNMDFSRINPAKRRKLFCSNLNKTDKGKKLISHHTQERRKHGTFWMHHHGTFLPYDVGAVVVFAANVLQLLFLCCLSLLLLSLASFGLGRERERDKRKTVSSPSLSLLLGCWWPLCGCLYDPRNFLIKSESKIMNEPQKKK